MVIDILSESFDSELRNQEQQKVRRSTKFYDGLEIARSMFGKIVFRTGLRSSAQQSNRCGILVD
jgi:hypothetical protein